MQQLEIAHVGKADACLMVGVLQLPQQARSSSLAAALAKEQKEKMAALQAEGGQPGFALPLSMSKFGIGMQGR